ELDDAGRRTVQGCIEAQVGEVTGGERGRRIPQAIEHALEQIQSSRGPRGRFKEEKERLEAVRKRIADLETKRNAMFAKMEELVREQQKRKELGSAWDDDEHQRELGDARNRYAAAVAKEKEIRAARDAL